MPLSSQAVLEKWGPIAAADPEGGSGPFHFSRADKELKAAPALEGSAMVARPTRPQT